MTDTTILAGMNRRRPGGNIFLQNIRGMHFRASGRRITKQEGNIAKQIGAILILSLIFGSCAGGPDSRKGLQEQTLRLENELTRVRNERNDLRQEIQRLEGILTRIQEITQSQNSENLPEAVAALENEARSNSGELEKLRREYEKSREEIERLSQALEEADFASSLFSPQTGASSEAGPSSPRDGGERLPAPEEPQSRAPAEPQEASSQERQRFDEDEDVMEKSIQDGTVFDPSSIGRSSGRLLEGSNIIQQQDEMGITYLSLENQRHSRQIPAYLEIQQRPGVGLSLYLVLQKVGGTEERPFGLYGGDIELAGSFLFTLPEAEYREQLIDPAYRLERIYIPVGRDLLQALESISTEGKGRIILKGLYGEEVYLINAVRARGLEEMISTFLELGNYS